MVVAAAVEPAPRAATAPSHQTATWREADAPWQIQMLLLLLVASAAAWAGARACAVVMRALSRCGKRSVPITDHLDTL